MSTRSYRFEGNKRFLENIHKHNWKPLDWIVSNLFEVLNKWPRILSLNATKHKLMDACFVAQARRDYLWVDKIFQNHGHFVGAPPVRATPNKCHTFNWICMSMFKRDNLVSRILFWIVACYSIGISDQLIRGYCRSLSQSTQTEENFRYPQTHTHNRACSLNPFSTILCNSQTNAWHCFSDFIFK